MCRNHARSIDSIKALWEPVAKIIVFWACVFKYLGMRRSIGCHINVITFAEASVCCRLSSPEAKRKSSNACMLALFCFLSASARCAIVIKRLNFLARAAQAESLLYIMLNLRPRRPSRISLALAPQRNGVHVAPGGNRTPILIMK